MQTQHITPTAAELQPFQDIKCRQTGCESVFTNMGSYELHLLKRHKMQTNRKKNPIIGHCCYYCPNEECIYNFATPHDGQRRHFKHIKNLRQHFQKVHCKNFVCEKCGRSFVTHGQLLRHVQETCGKRYKCLGCNLDFETSEARLTHAKRKGHDVYDARESKKHKSNKSDINKLTTTNHKETQTNFETAIITVVVHHNDTQTQTEQQHEQATLTTAALFQSDNETQTDILSRMQTTTPMLDDDINAIHHDIQTQTDLSLQQSTSTASSLANSLAVSSSSLFFDNFLTQTSTANANATNNSSSNTIASTSTAAAGADMHTQTCDAYLLSALGLSDIQTQTNWSSFEAQNHHHHPHEYQPNTISTSTSTAGFACDELLVSTETQTSFTQCLLESTTDINCGGVAVNNVVSHSSNVSSTSDESASTFAHLYTTQHTQTCDLLLDGLFGGQENDLIANFQSTYTQT